MKCEILIIAEHSERKLDPITPDLISCAAKIARAKPWKVGVLAIGCQLDGIVEELKREAVDFIFVAEDVQLASYNSSIYFPVITQSIQEIEPRLVLIGHTYGGIEIAAGISPRINAPVVSNCRSIETIDTAFVFTRPMFAGRFLATIEVKEAGVIVATMSKESSFSRVLPDRTPKIERLSPSVEAASSIKVIGLSEPDRAEDISRAEIVVSVGRGIRSPSQLSPFRELARHLGGVLAASRPLIDSGWLSNDHQVGLSGVTVRPKVYLAFGISGSAQHIAGMKQSKLIIAVNNDPSAPIFQVAHCGAVADMFEVLPRLLEKAKSESDARQSGASYA